MKELDDLFPGEPAQPGRTFLYLVPAIECKQCFEPMWLPYGTLPQADWAEMPASGEDPLEMPSEGWSKIFGCTDCGHIATYVAGDVEGHAVRKPTKSRFHVHANVWHVAFACANTCCKAPYAVHLSMPAHPATPNATDASVVVESLRDPRFDGNPLPCGHPLGKIPAKFYHATRVKDRMW